MILAAVKCILKCTDLIPQSLKVSVIKKLAAPLVTLLSCEPEIQYIALRNINFVLQKEPTIFETTTKVFYCKFNDPLYLKLEKIEVLVKVTVEANSEAILTEL